MTREEEATLGHRKLHGAITVVLKCLPGFRLAQQAPPHGKCCPDFLFPKHCRDETSGSCGPILVWHIQTHVQTLCAIEAVIRPSLHVCQRRQALCCRVAASKAVYDSRAFPCLARSSHLTGSSATSSLPELSTFFCFSGRKSFASRTSAKHSSPHLLKLPCKFTRLTVDRFEFSVLKDE